jgi:hypothetical protein
MMSFLMYPPNIITVINSRAMRCAGYVTHMGDKKNIE